MNTSFQPDEAQGQNSQRPGANVGEPSAPSPWLIEQLVATIGKAPAAIGRFLDRLANGRGPLRYVVRFFSSVILGLVWLGLTGVYIGLGSGLPQLRAYFDVTTMEFFDAWPMIVLMLLLILTLAVVTLRRIPLNIYKLGVWMVHVGIITLIIGCFFYFGMKREGMTRIFLHQTVKNFYDNTDRALYVQATNPAGAKAHAMIPLKALPIFDQRSPRHGNPLNIAIPSSQLAAINPALRHVKIKVIGYYPYAVLRAMPMPRKIGVTPRRPAVLFNLSISGHSGGRWLVATSPANRVLDTNSPFGVEYLYHPSVRRLRDISTSFAGDQALIVNIPAAHFRRVYVIHRNVPIVVKNTGYKITPLEPIDMPMLSKGYQGTQSQGYMLAITRKDKTGVFKFQRVALFRYPTRTPDFVFVHGQRKLVPNRIDHNIHIRYEDARHSQFWIVEDKTEKFTLIHRHHTGSVTVHSLTLHHPVPVVIDGIHLGFSILRVADARYRPYTIPKTDRRPKIEDTMNRAVLQISASDGKWKDHNIFAPFEQFGLTGDLPPTRVVVPGAGTLLLSFSQLARPLPVALTLLSCREIFYHGGKNFPRDFISKVRMTNLNTGRSHIATIHLNHPQRAMGLSFFQARFGRQANGQPFTVLGVGNTDGFYAMLTGVLLIVSGIGYAFYFKPVLLNIKKRQFAAYAARKTAQVTT